MPHLPNAGTLKSYLESLGSTFDSLEMMMFQCLHLPPGVRPSADRLRGRLIDILQKIDFLAFHNPKDRGSKSQGELKWDRKTGKIMRP